MDLDPNSLASAWFLVEFPADDREVSDKYRGQTMYICVVPALDFFGVGYKSSRTNRITHAVGLNPHEKDIAKGQCPTAERVYPKVG